MMPRIERKVSRAARVLMYFSYTACFSLLALILLYRDFQGVFEASGPDILSHEEENVAQLTTKDALLVSDHVLQPGKARAVSRGVENLAAELPPDCPAQPNDVPADVNPLRCEAYSKMSDVASCNTDGEMYTVFVDIDNTISDSIPRLRRCEKEESWPCERLSKEFWRDSVKDQPIRYAMQTIRAFKDKGYTVNFLTARSSYPKAHDVTSAWLRQNDFHYNELYVVSSPEEKISFLKKCSQISPPCMFIDDLMRGQELQSQSMYQKVYVKIRTEIPALKVEVFNALFNSWRHLALRYIPELASTSTDVLWQPHARMSSLAFTQKTQAYQFLSMMRMNVSCSGVHPDLYFSTKHNMDGIRYDGTHYDTHYELTMKVDFNISDLSNALAPDERLNIIPGITQRTGSKKEFCDLISRSGTPHSLACFLLPEQAEELQHTIQKDAGKNWIYKPDKTSGQGTGISLHINGSDINLDAHAVVQEYLSKPFLHNSKKLDMRLYPIVTATSPLRVYLSSGAAGGYARTASEAYENDFIERAAHITNAKEGKGKSRRLSLTELFNIVDARGLNSTNLQENLEEMLADVLVPLLNGINCWDQMFRHRCGNTHQILGVDVVLDENAYPYVVEVNPDPGWKYRTEEIWCHDAERTAHELSLIGLVPSSLYDCVIPPALLRLSQKHQHVDEHLLRMVYEYVLKMDAKLIFPKEHHLELFALDTYTAFFSIRPYIDELIKGCLAP